MLNYFVSMNELSLVLMEFDTNNYFDLRMKIDKYLYLELIDELDVNEDNLRDVIENEINGC